MSDLSTPSLAETEKGATKRVTTESHVTYCALSFIKVSLRDEHSSTNEYAEKSEYPCYCLWIYLDSKTYTLTLFKVSLLTKAGSQWFSGGKKTLKLNPSRHTQWIFFWKKYLDALGCPECSEMYLNVHFPLGSERRTPQGSVCLLNHNWCLTNTLSCISFTYTNIGFYWFLLNNYFGIESAIQIIELKIYSFDISPAKHTFFSEK